MSVKSPVGFAAGVLLPALSLGFMFSVLLNVVQFVTRPAPAAPVMSLQQPSSAAPTAEQQPPGAFGNVSQGRGMLAQRIDGIPAGVYRYDLPRGMLPQLPASMPLYRDPGVTADIQAFTPILSSMKIPLDLARLRPLPQDITLVTADNQFDILVNVRDRTMEISRINRNDDDMTEQAVLPLPDDQMVSIASEFASSLGIDMRAFSDPSVISIYRSSVGGKEVAPGAEEVRWPLKFGEYPVVDQLGRPVSAVSVFVAHRSKRAIALNMHVVSPDLFTRSEYKVADPSVITGFALEGGMAPVDGDEKGKSVTVTYQGAEIAYVLPDYRPDAPMYIAPAIVLGSDIPRTCKKPCTPWSWRTFVPALDPAQYAWLPRVEPAPSSSSAAVVSSQAASSVTSSAAAAGSEAPGKASSAPASASASSQKQNLPPTTGLQILQ